MQFLVRFHNSVLKHRKNAKNRQNQELQKRIASWK